MIIFLNTMLVFLSFTFLCTYCRFLICSYHGVCICWPIIISTCFKFKFKHILKGLHSICPSPTFCFWHYSLHFHAYPFRLYCIYNSFYTSLSSVLYLCTGLSAIPNKVYLLFLVKFSLSYILLLFFSFI